MYKRQKLYRIATNRDLWQLVAGASDTHTQPQQAVGVFGTPGHVHSMRGLSPVQHKSVGVGGVNLGPGGAQDAGAVSPRFSAGVSSSSQQVGGSAKGEGNKTTSS